MDKIVITISSQINRKIPTIFIPILISRLTKKTTLKNEICNYLPFLPKYDEILHHIEDNIKHNELSGASVTIELPTHNNSITGNFRTTSKKNLSRNKNIITKTTTKTKTKKLTDGHSQLYQLYIVVIKDNNTKNINELLENARKTGNNIFNAMKVNRIEKINLIDTVCESSYITALLEGLLLSTYQFLKYKTAPDSSEKFTPSQVHIISSTCKTINNSQIKVKQNILNNLKIEVESVFLARDLVNEPANNAKSHLFIKTIKDYIKKWEIPIKVEVLDKKDLEKKGFGLILGVGAGSNEENAPRIVIMKYNGRKGGEHDKPDTVLLGKGITFDTGGLDLKSYRNMSEMKTDLAGAATVMAFLLGYARIGGAKKIYTICPFAENSIGPNSVKPSDVLKAFNGKTVEITDTDAEGRLVLADCLSYANTLYPNAALIDFATLTGQQEAISCKMFSNVLGSNSGDDIAKMIKDGDRINEQLIEMPLMESKYLDKLDSSVADLKNVSTNCSADLILSAVFMRQFIKNTTKWIHIDIAGASWNNKDNVKYMSGEASGIGVRLLFEFFECC